MISFVGVGALLHVTTAERAANTHIDVCKTVGIEPTAGPARDRDLVVLVAILRKRKFRIYDSASFLCDLNKAFCKGLKSLKKWCEGKKKSIPHGLPLELDQTCCIAPLCVSFRRIASVGGLGCGFCAAEPKFL